MRVAKVVAVRAWSAAATTAWAVVWRPLVLRAGELQLTKARE
jgi:hypothetical protein